MVWACADGIFVSERIDTLRGAVVVNVLLFRKPTYVPERNGLAALALDYLVPITPIKGPSLMAIALGT